MKKICCGIKIRYSALIIIILAGIGIIVSNNLAIAEEILTNKQVIDTIAKRDGLQIENLEIINSAKTEYPLQLNVAFSYKVIDKKSGNIYEMSLDQKGNEIDIFKLLTDEKTAYTAKYGKKHQNLVKKLEVSSENDDIPVIIWLKEPQYKRPQRLIPNKDTTEEDVLKFYEQADTKRADDVKKVIDPIAKKLKDKGHQIKTDKYAPIIYAKLKPKDINDIDKWQEIDQIYLDDISKPLLNIARNSINADTVYKRHIGGFGVKVGEIEVGQQVGNTRIGARVATNNPNILGVTQDPTYACTNPNDHATGIAGIIRSWHPTIFGISPGVNLRVGGSCNGISSETQDRSTAAVDWGARILSLSFGHESSRTMDSTDRFYDNMMFNLYRTIVIAAGNEGLGTGNVQSPGLAYNAITVGNFDDRNTATTTDDIMDADSSWRDPISNHNDREKPEVAAPGTNIISTTATNPWTGNIGSGTSYATPMVTGIAADMIQRNRGLETWPEVIKAAIMTAATNNIEGDAVLSEFDGAGGVFADRADDIVRSHNFWYQSDTCSSPDIEKSIFIPAGTRMRTTLVWDVNPSFTWYANQPNADLDLIVFNPSGNVVANSNSYDNSYEIVDFTTSSSYSGYYKFRLHKGYCAIDPGWAVLAWRQGN